MSDIEEALKQRRDFLEEERQGVVSQLEAPDLELGQIAAYFDFAERKSAGVVDGTRRRGSATSDIDRNAVMRVLRGHGTSHGRTSSPRWTPRATGRGSWRWTST